MSFATDEEDLRYASSLPSRMARKKMSCHMPGSTRPKNVFSQFSRAAARLAGQPVSFLFAIAAVVIWMLTGPVFNYSDTWQLVINTSTTVITFLMVFLIQNTQNRDMLALQLKLDELVRAVKDARNTVLNLEELDDAELEAHGLRKHIARELLGERAGAGRAVRPPRHERLDALEHVTREAERNGGDAESDMRIETGIL